jgi:arylsulfatase A-like enzyme
MSGPQLKHSSLRIILLAVLLALGALTAVVFFSSPRAHFVATDLTERLKEATIRFSPAAIEDEFEFEGDGGWLFRPNGTVQLHASSSFWNRISLFPDRGGVGEGMISCRYRTQGPGGSEHRLSFVFHEAATPGERRRFELTVGSDGRAQLRYSEVDSRGTLLAETVLREVSIAPTNGEWRSYSARIDRASVRFTVDGRETLAYELPSNLMERVNLRGSWAVELSREGGSILPSDALLRRLQVVRSRGAGPPLVALSFRRGSGVSEENVRYLNFKYSCAREYIPPPERYALKQIALQCDEQQTELLPALFAPAGSSYRFPVNVERGDRLRVRFGLYQTAPPRPAAATFVVRLKSGDDWQVLLSETRKAEDTTVLRNLELSLPTVRHERAELELSVTAPDDGGKENGGGSDAALGLWGAPRIMRRRGVGESRRPNVILISVDTLRRDAVGVYDPRQASRTISLDRFASGATLFTRAYSVSPWTTPSHYSLLSGRYPSRHGLDRAFGVNSEAYAEVETLAQLLGRAGYVTMAIASDHSLDPRYGFDKGFDEFLDNQVRDAEPLMGSLKKFLQSHTEDEFFLFFHSYDPHAPLAVRNGSAADAVKGHGTEIAYKDFLGRPPATEVERSMVRELYGEAVADYDARFGRILGMLDDYGVLENSVIVFTSDHGEELFDHGVYMHGHALYEELLRVPLIIKFPKGSHFPPRYEKLTGLIDVAPTLLDYLGIPVPANLDGRSVLSGLNGAAEEPRRYLLAEALAWGPERKAVVTDRYKYIVTFARDALPWLGPRTDTYDTLFATDPGSQLFDLRQDPDERKNVVADEPDLVKRMEALLRPLLERQRTPRGAIEVDPERIKALRDLGYIQ